MNLFESCFSKHYQNQNKAQTWPITLVPTIEARAKGCPNLLGIPLENNTGGIPSI